MAKNPYDQSMNEKNTRTVTIGLVIMLVALLLVSLKGCDISRKNETKQMQACVAAGKIWYTDAYGNKECGTEIP